MRSVEFKGFAGVRLHADVRGDADAPAILRLHGAEVARADWADSADALRQAGRQVIALDLRGTGESEGDESAASDTLLDILADDLRAVLAQLPARPVIIAEGAGGHAAIIALGEGGGHLASGLILADAMPTGHDDAKRLTAAATNLALPVLTLTDGALAFPDHERAASDDDLNAILLDFLERRIPLAPPEYREGSDARTFRDALGCFATGVTVVTAFDSAGTPVGLTANSFTSVSLDPPLLLVCIANGAGSAPVMRVADRFAVNVLQIGQQLTSNRFAGKGEDRFAATPWARGEFGTPVLSGSLASFECESHAVHDGGDHFILVGRVLKAMFEPRRDPLLYFRGKYRRLHFA
jgi:flavin reductase (DIM6/NTAB) family NADH-FMN oxidoreductase RutF